MPTAVKTRPKSRHRGDLAPASQAKIAKSWIVLLPVSIAIVLNLPNLGLGYFWDDFYFLTGIGGSRNYLLPDPHTVFYRPIPQSLYFSLLRLVDPTEGFIGHVLNLAVLCASIALLVLLVSRLCGPRAGFFSGLVFASYGHVSSLVGWISASQDLFAIALVLAAFYLRDRGKIVLPIVCATAALFCKEPAVAAFPVLAFWDRIRGRPPSRERAQLIAYFAIGLSWALFHPGIRMLVGQGFRSGATGYVGIEHPGRWGLYFARYALSLLNLPPPGLAWSWWEERAPYGLAALAVLIAGLLYVDRRFRPTQETARVSLARVGWIGALFTLPTLLLPAVLIRHWAPYYACIPALGVAIFLGPVIARQNRLAAFLAIVALLILGMWYRGVRGVSEPTWSEPVFVEASQAVTTLRENLNVVIPTIPKGAQIVASVSSTGVRGIQSTLIDGQALSVWYRDPALRTVTTLTRQPGPNSEILVRVTSALDVITIDPETHRVRTNRAEAPDLDEINRPLSNYARSLAAGGETDRAVRILDGLAKIEPEANAAFDRRMMASFLMVAGRRRQADSLLATTPSFPREDALAIVKRLLGEASQSEKLDQAAFEALGLSREDPETMRWIVREFRREGSLAQAAWYARKLQRLVPGDPESAEILRDAAKAGIEARRVPV